MTSIASSLHPTESVRLIPKFSYQTCSRPVIEVGTEACPRPPSSPDIWVLHAVCHTKR